MILSSRLLLVGLGNSPLPATRHSVGHLIIDSLANRLGIPLAYDASVHGHHGQGRVSHPTTPYEVTLYKSKSLMNVSGPSVQKILRKTSHTPQSLVVIHDSLSHRLDVVSRKLGGSANGHNGVKSVISALGTPDFHRLRIGIGKNEGVDAAGILKESLLGDPFLRRVLPFDSRLDTGDIDTTYSSNSGWLPGQLGIVPPLEINVDHVVWIDIGKDRNPWYEDVDFEPLEAEFVTTDAPVEDPPAIIDVSRLDSVKPTVFLAGSSLDGFRTAGVSGEAKDIKVLIRTVNERADVCAFFEVPTEQQFPPHPSDRAAIVDMSKVHVFNSSSQD